ncbi:energy-coupling factor transporter ATP-binding protein EcfA2 [Leuconostoc litchii]|uniref:Energy-coupling factor transporter ATP-binding protein EcfA2 n=1 Tax=Leuconostoc litchii TaxID=1981069 RepID=A0A6P2CRD9_9LACO|nr:energy-coupling factor transporter ATPase [Leuconostoc litchii]TYC47672.1 energy-coupling factor transporter ATPase [Leuconostoc litchii]GMA69724.1 energy-coupling factor transporter ATP-binding protein EcfA2 [Leuconostoc litchii]
MAINFEQVNFSYGAGTTLAQPILHDINVTIPDGQVTAIVGQTGSGKSTLIQHLNGLLKPTSGRIIIDDFILTNGIKEKQLTGLRARVGMVFQFPENQLFANTVLDDVMYAPINFGYSKREAQIAAKEALKRVHVSEKLWHKSPFELSGGQMRRVAMAGTLASNPDIVVLDEPAAGLDPKGQNELLNIVRDLKSAGKLVVLISHQMDHVIAVADHMIVMNNGRVAAEGTPTEIFNRDLSWFKEVALDLPKAGQFAEKLRQKGRSLSRRPLLLTELAKMLNGDDQHE